MAMVAIDIIWPFFGSGPMYTQISRHLQSKCLSSWWMNLIALGNVQSAPENVSNNILNSRVVVWLEQVNYFFIPCYYQCIPHTFYSSIDIQLYILGLIMVFLLCKKPTVGIIGCLSLAVLGNLWVVFRTSKVLMSPVLIDANVTAE